MPKAALAFEISKILELLVESVSLQAMHLPNGELTQGAFLGDSSILAENCQGCRSCLLGIRLHRHGHVGKSCCAWTNSTRWEVGMDETLVLG